MQALVSDSRQGSAGAKGGEFETEFVLEDVEPGNGSEDDELVDQEPADEEEVEAANNGAVTPIAREGLAADDEEQAPDTAPNTGEKKLKRKKEAAVKATQEEGTPTVTPATLKKSKRRKSEQKPLATPRSSAKKKSSAKKAAKAHKV
mmetsp:Transcript_963/g.2957  ORF Transcript_963/g.2957 Transcript_963/m.2957 type:complete len:147 (+) Transcript_963:143-583(+)